MTRQDIQVSNNSIVIFNNDFVWDDSDSQHIEDTINAYPGWWKENPFDGVGIFSYYKSKGTQQLLAKNIKLQLQADGYNMSNAQIGFLQNELLVKPNASR